MWKSQVLNTRIHKTAVTYLERKNPPNYRLRISEKR